MLSTLWEKFPLPVIWVVIWLVLSLSTWLWKRWPAILDRGRSALAGALVGVRARRWGTFVAKPPGAWVAGLRIGQFGQGVAHQLHHGVEGRLPGGREFRIAEMTTELWHEWESHDPAGDRYAADPDPDRCVRSRVMVVRLDRDVVPVLVRSTGVEPTPAPADTSSVESGGFVAHASDPAYARRVMAAVSPSLAHWPAEHALDLAVDGHWLAFTGLPDAPAQWRPWMDFAGDLANLVSAVEAPGVDPAPDALATQAPGFVLGGPSGSPASPQWLWPWSAHTCTLVGVRHGVLPDGSPAYAGSLEWWEHRELEAEAYFDLGTSPRVVAEGAKRLPSPPGTREPWTRFRYRVRMRHPVVAVANPRGSGDGLVVALHSWQDRLGDPVGDAGSGFRIFGAAEKYTDTAGLLVRRARPVAVAWTQDWVIAFTHRNDPSTNVEYMGALAGLREATTEG